MITKVQSNNSGINFQSKVNVGSNAVDILEKRLSLYKRMKFLYQIYKLRHNKQENHVFVRGFRNAWGEGIKLSVKTNEDLIGENSFEFSSQKHSKFNLIDMYKRACKQSIIK